MTAITSKHLHRRLLLTDKHQVSRIEATVLELSPSGEQVKLRNNIANAVFWCPVSDYLIVEELAPRRHRPVPEE